MLETLISCPFCNSEQISFFIETKDYTVSGENFQLSKCNNCGLIFTNPRPDKESIAKYYESEDYISHTNARKGLFNSIYQSARRQAIKRKYSFVEKYSVKTTQNLSLLDIGCGTGEFLSYCKQQDIQCTGIEPSPKARGLAIANHNLNVLDAAELDSLPAEAFDAITMWHVIEHVHDLVPTVKAIQRLLRAGGACFIAVPNPTSYDSLKYKDRWAAFDVPRHLFHFAPQTIKNIFQKTGFEFITSLPMKLDSYYVSLLSEKYKSNKKLTPVAVLKSAYTGWMSNLKAKNPEGYSSVIYVFRKTT